MSTYLKAFETFEQNGFREDPSWLKQMRKNAMDRFQQLGFPTMRDEYWKYTNVTPIAKTQFQLISEAPNLTLDQIQQFLFGQGHWQRLVFVNGSFSKNLSQIKTTPGVTMTSLSEALRKNEKSAKPYFAQYADSQKNTFTALNTAFFHDGAFLRLSQKTTLNEPVLLLFISVASGEKLPLNQIRNLIVLDESAKASVIERHVHIPSPHPLPQGEGKGEGGYFSNSVTEIVLGAGSEFEYHQLEHEGQNGFHIGTTQVNQAENSKFISSAIAIDGKLVRNNLNVILSGEHATCMLNGFYMAAGNEHIDNHTLIDHPKPNGTSRQMYKGILTGKSTGVFSGKIFVHQDSQKTDASQINKNLLLSKDATVNTKPQLEILADDVKCTHGAAVGQLEDDAIFYLKTRGIDEQAASKLLSYGFAGEVINQISIEPVREELNRIIRDKLEVSFSSSEVGANT